jgi:PKD repeat protein
MKQITALILFVGFGLGLKAQCLAPTNFVANNITTSSISIDLNGSGSGPWEVEYGLSGFVIGNGITINTANKTLLLTSLSPATSYRVFIRRSCGSINSPWNTFSFVTSCGSVLNSPVTFNFEGAVWQSPTNPTGTGNVGTCWIVSPQGTNTFWAAGPAHETRLKTGPVGDHSTGFGTFIHLNGLGISIDSISSIQSPAIDLFGLSNPQLKFWYHMFGAGIDSLEVMVRNNSDFDWDTLHTFHGQQQLNQEEPWLPITLSLSAFMDSAVNIQFVAYAKGTEVQMAIDDLSIYDSGTCLPSTFFRTISNDDTSVLLDWDPGSGSSHVIEYGLKGFTLGTGTLLSLGSHPFRISNLLASTNYEFYLRDQCGSTQASSWTRALEVYTDCPSEYGPFAEDFEGPPWPNGGLEPCWDRYDYLDFKWNVGPPALNYAQSGPGSNNHSPGGSKFIVANRPNQKGKARSSVTSPLIDLDTIINPELTFWTHMFGLQIIAFDISVDSGNGFNLVKRIIGPQQLSKSAPWTEHIISLSAYSGKTVKVKFTGIAASNWSSLSRIAVDDFSIGESPPCRKPTNLQLDQVNFTSASVSWLSGGATDWIVRLQANGSSSALTATSSNPLFLTQLQAGTEYTIWVRDSCGPGLVSDWSAPLDFKTYCLPDATPYFEDFEGTPFQVQSSWFTTGTLHPCWERSHELGPIWQPSPATILPNNLLPTQDHTSGSGKYIGGSLFLGNGTNEATSFTSPHIDLTNLNRPELSFWFYLGGYSFSSNQLQVEVNNGTGWQNISTIFGPQQLSTSAAWIKEVLDLSYFRDDTIRLRFKTIGSNLYAATAGGVDDISIYNNPNCLPPSNLQALYVTSTRAIFKWTTGGASNWVVKYKPNGGNFQFQNTAINDSFALSNLVPGTRYEFWVRDSCATAVSSWLGPIFIVTDCIPNSVPFYESFDGPFWIPALISTKPGAIDNCWRRSDSVYKAWLPSAGASASGYSGPSGSRSGSGNYLMTERLAPPPSNIGPNEFRSPLIINTGLQQPELNFWYHMHGPQIQKLLIYVENMDDSRILIDSVIGQQQNGKNAAWLQRSISLSAFQSDTLKIVFNVLSGNGQGKANVAIDDVEIIDGICSDPLSLGATSITTNSAVLNWTSVSAHSTIEFGLAGFSIGSGSRINGLSSGYNLIGLQAFSTYEFYVRDSCRNNNSSWAGPYLFTTFCAAPVADFSHQGSSLSLNFDGSPSVGTALIYHWDFGDGNSGTGLNPNHTYSIGGFYNVGLISTDTCGLSDTLIKNIQVCETPQAVINYTRNGLTVNFDGISSLAATQYYWDFGSAGIATIDSPQVTFPAKGSYTIVLIVTNACGARDTTSFRILICDKPTASFTTSISAFPNLLIVNFDGTASTFVDSYVWDFGDGTKDSTSLTPMHIYPTNSLNYVTRLIVKADCGWIDTLAYPLSGPIYLTENEVAQISVYPNPADNRMVVVVENQQIKTSQLLWFDVSGKQYEVPLLSKTDRQFEFDVSGLATGEYLLFLKAKQGASFKITIK